MPVYLVNLSHLLHLYRIKTVLRMPVPPMHKDKVRTKGLLHQLDPASNRVGLQRGGTLVRYPWRSGFRIRHYYHLKQSWVATHRDRRRQHLYTCMELGEAGLHIVVLFRCLMDMGQDVIHVHRPQMYVYLV